MLRRIGCGLAALLLAAGLAAPGLARELPHRLHIEPYDGGKQIQVIVGFIITRAECRHLIAAYRERAKGGQVSVHRPIDSKSRGRGPWCVDNLDGRGVTFNDDLFDWEPYSGAERRR